MKRIILVGEAPGKEEIKQGKPFVGRSGKLLNAILEKDKIKRENLYITNLIKVKLPKNRKPNQKEIRKYLPLLKKEIKKAKPKLIVLLGESVTKALLGRQLKSVRGKIIKSKNISYLATYHPSAARFPNVKNKIIKDFAKIRKYF